MKNGLSVATANYYMTTMAGMFQFAADNGYIRENPFNGIRPLKRARIEPDPLTRDEFIRFIDACPHQQTKTCGPLRFTQDYATVSWSPLHGKT